MMDTFAKYFDTAFSSREGIIKLKELIIEFGVRGRLSTNDSSDNISPELLSTIKRKSNSLDQTRIQISNLNNSGISDNAKSDEELNNNWKYVLLGDVLSFEYGDNLPANKRSNSGEFPVFSSNGIVGSHDIAFVKKPCIVIGRKGSAGAINLSLGPGCVVTDVSYYCIPPNYIDIKFAYRLLQSLKLDSLGKGIKPGLNRNEAYSIIIGIPPKAEQERIAIRIEKLLTICDELEKLRAARDQKRLAVHTAAIRRLLDAPDPEAFADAWQFIATHFSELYTVRENVAELRKAILQLAVMGRLVEQDEREGTANNEEGHTLSPIDKNTNGYNLPQSWKLSKLEDLITNIDSGWSPACELTPAKDDEWGVLKTTAVQSLKFLPHENKALPRKLKPRPSITVEQGDILITRAGPKNRVGICCVVKNSWPKLMLSDKIIRMKFRPESINPDYLALSLSVGVGAEQLESAKSGMAESQMNISQDKIRQITILVPPLKEQIRTIQIVERLLIICGALEQQIEAFDHKSEELMVSVVAEFI